MSLSTPGRPHRTLALVEPRYENLRRIFRRVAQRIEAGGDRVEQHASAEALHADVAACARADVLLCDGVFPVDDAFLARSPRLRGALSAIIGSEGFDLPAATRHGVLLGNGQVFENWRSVAEATVLMTLAAVYELNGAQAILRENRPRPDTRNARMLYGKQVGFIGFGRIAQEVARLLQTWQLKMVYHARRDAQAPGLPVERVDLDALLKGSDVVIVLAPLNADSARMLDARRIASMKPGAHLVNLARGGIVDEEALHDALRSGHLAGAALDTFEVEPLPADSPLRTHAHAVLTPHLVGHTVETYEAVEENAVAGVQRLFRGEPPPFLLNPEALDAFRARLQAVPA